MSVCERVRGFSAGTQIPKSKLRSKGERVRRVAFSLLNASPPKPLTGVLIDWDCGVFCSWPNRPMKRHSAHVQCKLLIRTLVAVTTCNCRPPLSHRTQINRPTLHENESQKKNHLKTQRENNRAPSIYPVALDTLRTNSAT